MQWTTDNPGAGDLNDVRRAALCLTTAADRADLMAHNLRMLGAEALNWWQSPNAAGAWSTRLEDQTSKFTSGSTPMRAMSVELTTYVDAVMEIKAVVYPARAALEGLANSANATGWLHYFDSQPSQRQICNLSFWVDATDFEPERGEAFPLPTAPDAGWFGAPPSGPVDSLPRAQAWAAFITEEGEFHSRRISRQVPIRRSADSAVAGVMAALAPTWAEMQAIFHAYGITDPTQMTPVDYAAKLVERYGLGDVTVLDEIVGLLKDSSHDPAIMTALFLGMDAETQARLIDDLGGPWNLDARATGRRLREGLGVASATWTDEQISAFTDPLFEFPATPQMIAMVSLLFSGHTWPSMRLPVAAADAVDAYERTNTVRYALEGEPILGFGANALAGGDLGRDGAGAIIRSLAQDKGQSVTWLSSEDPEGEGAARREHWFGRDWNATGDGFRSPAILLEATQFPIGDLIDPETGLPRDPAVSEKIAQIFSHAATTLHGNPAFSMDTVADSASQRLAAAMAANLLSAVESAGSKALGRADTTNGAALPEEVLQGHLPVAAIDATVWDTLLGVAQKTTTGKNVLAGGLVDYGNFLVERSAHSGERPGAYTHHIVSDLSLCHAAVGLTMSDNAIHLAQIQDAHVQTAVTVGAGAVGILAAATPGLNLAGGVALTAGVSAGTAFGGDRLIDLYAHHTADALGTRGVDITASQLSAREDILKLAAQDAGIELPALPDKPTDDDQQDWYDESVGLLDKYIRENLGDGIKPESLSKSLEENGTWLEIVPGRQEPR